ncbi:MAG: shikimate dehydrogenase, partial [Candidatus Micrarchaeia archaeon]
MHKAKISVPVTTPYPKTLKDAKKAAENKADLIELRLDLIKPTATQLKTLIKTIQIPIIATSRTKKEGGKTTPKQAKQQLTNAIEAKPAFIDIELSLNTKMRKKLTKKAKAKKIKIISSTHYTKTTPKLSTLKKTLQKQLKENADAYKIVTYAKKETDNQTLTKLAEHANNKKLKIITFAMGKKGKQSRINSINNSYITFAALEKGKESAPGQITLKKALELKQGYSNYARKNTKTITLLGYPVTHSKSPQMQNAAFKKLNLNYKYISIPTPPSKFKEKLKKLEQNPNVKGANITTPHKLQALNQCKHNDKSATQTLAANTLVKENNHFKTFNTDAKGFTQALKEKNVKITRKKTVVLGAGGAARAILFALTQKKPSQTTIINRTHQKAQALAKQFPKTQATPWTQENLEKTIANADLLINTTTIGMHPNNQSPIPKQILHKKQTVFDAVYNPKQTKLLKDAKAKGCKTISGHAMLLYQGTAAFELWTKTKAP